MLVIQPLGGPDDWQGLFHEAGHTEHFAHMSPGLAIEERKLGDNAVTVRETYVDYLGAQTSKEIEMRTRSTTQGG